MDLDSRNERPRAEPEGRGRPSRPSSVRGSEDSVETFSRAGAASPRILAVALAEIVQRGYDATSVRTIAREVGVTVPVLYYYYENKQAILVALLDTAMGLVTSRVEEALASAGDDPVRRLSAVVEAVCLYMAGHPDLAFLDSERRSLDPANLEHYLAQRDRIDAVVDAAIADGVATGLFRTAMPGTVRRAILSMCQGIATWFRQDGPTTPAETAAEHVRIALAAVQWDPDARRTPSIDAADPAAR